MKETIDKESVVQDARAAFLRFMTSRGLNVTSQRQAIANIFFGLSGHHSLEELYHEISRRDPSIGQTTVYRTLKLLCEAGLAGEIHFGDGMTRYEPMQPEGHHDHLICQKCGKTVELCDQRVEKIQRELAEQHGFTLLGHVHNLYGLCEACRGKKQ